MAVRLGMGFRRVQPKTGRAQAEIESAGCHRRALRTGVKPSKEDMTHTVPVATDNSVVEQWVLQSERAAISRMTAMNVKKVVATESFIFGEARMTVKRISSSGL
jgi:PBP1b-binding outer membrane lipoprotein LpoB